MPLSSLFRAFAPKPTRRVRIAVVGAGRMGQNHVRHLSHNQRAELVGVVDNDLAKAQHIADRYRSHAFSDPQELIGKIEAVVIATPTQSHAALGKLFLKSGIACLIEKPLASSIEEADEMVRLANDHKQVLQVGHIERFNAAVIAAAQYIESPRFIEVNRLGPFDPRVTDVGVVLDLMIHDLDIVLFLVGDKVTRVESFGAKVLSNHEDIAKVRLHFSKGCIVDLSASRVSLKKYRHIRIFQHNAYLSLDYAARHLKVYRKKTENVKSLSDIQILSPKLSHRDPLALELDHFLDCVLESKIPLVSGSHGRDALELARQVLENLEIHA